MGHLLQLFLLLLFMAVGWAGCKQDAKIAADTNPIGTYALVCGDGHKVPFAVSTKGPRRQSNRHRVRGGKRHRHLGGSDGWGRDLAGNPLGAVRHLWQAYSHLQDTGSDICL